MIVRTLHIYTTECHILCVSYKFFPLYLNYTYIHTLQLPYIGFLAVILSQNVIIDACTLKNQSGYMQQVSGMICSSSLMTNSAILFCIHTGCRYYRWTVLYSGGCVPAPSTLSGRMHVYMP